MAIIAALLGVSVMVSCKTEKSRENSHSTTNTTGDKAILFYEEPTENFTSTVSTTATGNMPKKTTTTTTVTSSKKSIAVTCEETKVNPENFSEMNYCETEKISEYEITCNIEYNSKTESTKAEDKSLTKQTVSRTTTAITTATEPLATEPTVIETTEQSENISEHGFYYKGMLYKIDTDSKTVYANSGTWYTAISGGVKWQKFWAALCLCDTVTDNTIRSALSYAAFMNGKKPQNWAEVTARIQSGEISAVEGIRLLGIKRCTYYILKKRESEES